MENYGLDKLLEKLADKPDIPPQKIIQYIIETNKDVSGLQEKLTIAVAEVLKKGLKRTEIDRIGKNITNIYEIFNNEIPSIEEAKPYLHAETREVIVKAIELVLADNIPNEISKFSIKNNIVAMMITNFLDWIIYKNSNHSL